MPKVIVQMKAKRMGIFGDKKSLGALEYCVVGALIAVAVITIFVALGGSVSSTVSIIDAVLPG